MAHVTHGDKVSSHPGHGQGQGHPPPFAQLPPIVGVVAEAANALDAIAGGVVIATNVLEAAAASDLADAISIVSADAIEAANAFDEADAAIGAQVLFGTVAEAADAGDELDAVARHKPAYGGGWSPILRPMAVSGNGHGVLPALRGEAHGTVGVAGIGAAALPIEATAAGEVDDFPNDLEVMLMLLVA